MLSIFLFAITYRTYWQMLNSWFNPLCTRMQKLTWRPDLKSNEAIKSGKLPQHSSPHTTTEALPRWRRIGTYNCPWARPLKPGNDSWKKNSFTFLNPRMGLTRKRFLLSENISLSLWLMQRAKLVAYLPVGCNCKFEELEQDLGKTIWSIVLPTICVKFGC